MHNQLKAERSWLKAGETPPSAAACEIMRQCHELPTTGAASNSKPMHQTFQAEQWLSYPTETVFACFANPENLPRLMPKWQKTRIEEATFRPPPPRPATSPLPGIAAGDGTRLTLSFCPFPYSPIRLTWVAAIGQFVWNEQFCDTQVSGPFFFWHHCHKVSSAPHPQTGAPGTLLRDEVEFQLPLDPVSRLALPLVRAQFAAMFRYRHQRTAELLFLSNG